MPLPLLIAVPALAGLAGTGVRKGFTGVRKLRDARAIDAQARELFDLETQLSDQAQQTCEEGLARLGEERQHVFNEAMPAFIEVVSRLRNASVVAEAFNDQLSVDDIPPGLLHDVALRQQELVRTAATSVVGGYAASQAATAGVLTYATASTGTAISTLGGGAASNAALAWLGGGSLAAGGSGIAGGTLILGGIAAAPAVLVGGLIFDRQMTTKLRRAQANADEVDSAVAKMHAHRARLSALVAAADGATPVFQRLRTRLVMEAGTIAAYADGEADVVLWTEAQQTRLRTVANLAGLLVALASSPLVGDDGGLNPGFDAALSRAA